MPRRRTVASLKRLGRMALAAVSREIIEAVIKNVIREEEDTLPIKVSPSLERQHSVMSTVDEIHLQNCISAAQSTLFDGLPQWLGEELVPLWLQVLGSEVRRRNHEGGQFTPSHQAQNQGLSRGDAPTGDVISPRMRMELTDTVYVLLRLTEVAVWPRLHKLDLTRVSKQLRTFLYNHLDSFNQLKMLDLGPGTGGWLSEAFLDSFYDSGLRRQSCLTVFRLHHDCTNQILETLLMQCGHTLRVIDAQYSQFVDDSVLPELLKRARPDMVELGLTGTGVSVGGCAQLLRRFRKLKKFFVDNIGEVLAHASREAKELKEPEEPVFDLIDFRPAHESCYYYEPYNMDLMSRACPKLAKVCLGAATAHALNFAALPQFSSLRELALAGGVYDPTNMSVLARVPSLTQLELNHVEMISFSVIADLAKTCTGLKCLILKNCHLLSDPILGRVTAKWPSLSRLVVHSRCEHNFLLSLLLLCPDLEELKLGISTDISDRLLAQLIRLNSRGLHALQSFSVAHSDALTMFGVFQLVNQCSNLQIVQDLDSCSSISQEEIQSLNQWVKEHNLVLKTTQSSANNFNSLAVLSSAGGELGQGSLLDGD